MPDDHRVMRRPSSIAPRGRLRLFRSRRALQSAPMLDPLATDQLLQSGFIRQEDLPLNVYLENRFGQVYAKPQTGVPHQRLGGSGQ
jgi:hypothetical protein